MLGAKKFWANALALSVVVLLVVVGYFVYTLHVLQGVRRCVLREAVDRDSVDVGGRLLRFSIFVGAEARASSMRVFRPVFRLKRGKRSTRWRRSC